MTKVSSTNQSHKWVGGGWAYGLDFKLLHEQVSNKWANGGTHGHNRYLFEILTLEEEVSIFQAEPLQGDYLRDGHGWYLGWKVDVVWFFIRTSCPIFKFGTLSNFLSSSGSLLFLELWSSSACSFHIHLSLSTASSPGSILRCLQ